MIVIDLMKPKQNKPTRTREKKLLFFRNIGLLTPLETYGGVEGPPHIFFDIMVSHTGDLVTRP